MDNEINLDTIGYIENNILYVHDGVEKIPNHSFKGKGLIGVKLPNSVTEIGYGAFANNQIKEIELPPDLRIIDSEAFQGNQITNIKIPPKIKALCRQVFASNNISNLVVPNNIIEIDHGALSCETLLSIEIPSSVKRIGMYIAGDKTQITYDGTNISKKLVKIFNTENIIIISKILKIMPSFNFDYVPKNILETFPSEFDIDFLKSYEINIKKFNLIMEQLKEKYSTIRDEELKDIFKMFYSLGFFKTGGEKQEMIITHINMIINHYGIDGVHQLFTDITLTKFQPKFANLVLNEYQHPKLNEVISRFYREYDEIVRIVKRKKEKMLGVLHTKYNNTSDEEAKEELNKELEYLKENKNNVLVDDVIAYTIEQIFEVRVGNEPLYQIVQQLAPYVDQDQFNKIQDIYEAAVFVERYSDNYFQKVHDREQDDIHYYWSPGDNPTNIILGYICECCAKYGGAGEDIMIQSMINPQIKNLIVYDGMRNIIGKATAFYHLQDKYILFNNIEIASRAVKLKKDDKILNSILRGIYDQISVMRKKGIEVKEVRIGMLRNDLAQMINDRKIKIEHDNLLDNYNYNNYAGDANDKKSGQAVIDISTELKI